MTTNLQIDDQLIQTTVKFGGHWTKKKLLHKHSNL